MAFTGLIIVGGCKKDEPADTSQELSVSPEQISVHSGPGKYSAITVISNTRWTATSNVDWCTVDPASAEGDGDGVITLSVTQNILTEQPREATITVAVGELKRIVTVRQATGILLSVNPEQILVDADSGKDSITIMANTAWKAESNVKWLSISPASAEGDTVMTVTFTENNDKKPRTATITVKAGSQIRTLTVTQAEQKESVKITFAGRNQILFYAEASNIIIVDWGDGIQEQRESGNIAHTYNDGNENAERTVIIWADIMTNFSCNSADLTDLDVSRNTNLRVLAFDNNSLTSIDLSNNPDLEILWCPGNKLSSLTGLSGKHNLWRVHVERNQLDADDLNQIIDALPDRSNEEQHGQLDIRDNPGTDYCNSSIAVDKNWLEP